MLLLEAESDVSGSMIEHLVLLILPAVWCILHVGRQAVSIKTCAEWERTFDVQSCPVDDWATLRRVIVVIQICVRVYVEFTQVSGQNDLFLLSLCQVHRGPACFLVITASA